MREIVGELDNRLGAGRLDDLVGPFGADDRADRGVHVGGRPGIEAVGGAALARHLELAVHEIDGNDRVGAGELANWTTLRPTPPTPNTTTDSPSFTLASLLMTPAAVVTAQPSSGAILQIEVGRDHRHAVFRNDGIFVERRDPAGIELLAAPR